MEQHLSQYRIFYEVARCGNISRAAKELYISQPAISKAIGKLEESLGTRLFLRNSRGVQLTPEGNVLFQHVAAAFDSLSRGEKELKRIHDFHIGQLKIGVSNTLCKYVLLPYLKSFVEKYPHVNITIESQSTAHTLEMLEARKIDIGLVAEPRARRGLNFTPVMEIHDGFVCTPAYMENLTLREGPAPDIFKTGNIMLLDRSNMSRKHLDTYLSRPGHRGKPASGGDRHGPPDRIRPHRSGHRLRDPGFCLRRSEKRDPHGGPAGCADPKAGHRLCLPAPGPVPDLKRVSGLLLYSPGLIPVAS